MLSNNTKNGGKSFKSSAWNYPTFLALAEREGEEKGERRVFLVKELNRRGRFEVMIDESFEKFTLK